MDQIDQKLASISKQQAEGITQINVGVNRLDKLTQSNAANAEKSAATAAALSDQTENLKHTVTELLQLIGNNSAEVKETPAAHLNGHRRNGKTAVPVLDTLSI